MVFELVVALRTYQQDGIFEVSSVLRLLRLPDLDGRNAGLGSVFVKLIGGEERAVKATPSRAVLSRPLAALAYLRYLTVNTF